MTSKNDLEKLYQDLSAKEKQLDILVCNSGISGAKADPSAESATELKKTLWDNETFEDWNSTYNTNVTSVYFTT